MKSLLINIILFIPVLVAGQSYTGGSGSGDDMAIYLSTSNYYKGGEGDGYDADKYIETKNYFTGGEGDGFSSEVLNSTKNYFIGSQGDGYDKGDYLYYHLWTGSYSTAWDNIQNWTLNIVPDVNTRVQIPVVSVGNFYPVLTAGSFHVGEGVVGPNYMCRALWIHPNAKMTQAIGVSAENYSDILIEGVYLIPNIDLGHFTNKPGSTLRIEGNGLFQAGN